MTIDIAIGKGSFRDVPISRMRMHSPDCDVMHGSVYVYVYNYSIIIVIIAQGDDSNVGTSDSCVHLVAGRTCSTS